MLRRKFLSLAAAGTAAAVLAACGKKEASAPAAASVSASASASASAAASAPAASGAVTVKVGASPVPHADLLKVVAPALEKEGVKLQIVEFNDYVQPNVAVEDKGLDVNFFQHRPYLDSFQKDRKTHLTVLAPVHIEPIGLYPGKSKDLKSIPSGAQIAIPNDATNGGRALILLQKAGLLKLKDGVSITATVADIVSNPHKIKIVEVEAATLPRTLQDVNYAVINSNYAIPANLNPVKDALVTESGDSPYANILVCRQGDENRPELQKLAKAMQSSEVKAFIEKTYKGAVVPAF